VTAIGNLISPQVLARLLEWPQELDDLGELASMMRKPGLLSCPDEPRALHHMAAARDETRETRQ
jgi:hypothetical protein